MSEEQKQELLNQMWRNGCISDTYEPGSTFKVITASAGLEEGVVTPESTFHCPGYIIDVDKRQEQRTPGRTPQQGRNRSLVTI